jgi:hypothetical protein
VWSVNATLFGEAASRIIVSATTERLEGVLSEAEAAGVSVMEIGHTGGHRIRVSVDGAPTIDAAVADAEQSWSTAIEQRMRAGAGSRRAES